MFQVGILMANLHQSGEHLKVTQDPLTCYVRTDRLLYLVYTVSCHPVFTNQIDLSRMKISQ